MSICVRTISCTALLAFEAHLGDFTLQNYDAIRTDSIAASHASTYLRAILLSLLILPLGLSIGYKQFLGGSISSSIGANISRARYGIHYPSLGDYSTLNTVTYLWLNAYSGFASQVNPKTVPPLPDDLPNRATPYGYNVLLLSNTTAAAVDLPSRGYMESIRRTLKLNETWYIDASVNAFVAELNSSLDQVRNNNTFWKSTLQHTNPQMRYHGLTTILRGGKWSDFGFGLILEYQNNTGRGFGSCMLGMYVDKVSDVVTIKQYDKYDDDVVLAFRKSALQFDVYRRRCNARWRITAESIHLLSGECSISSSVTEVDSRVVEDYAPPSIDSLPNLWPTLNWLNTTIKSDSVPAWKIPSYAVAVAVSYWSRAASQMESGALEKYADVDYAPTKESIVSSRSTLQACWLLYLILSVQPVLGLFELLLIFALRETPIGGGFDTHAILTRLQPSSLVVLDDVSLAGKVDRPIWLHIQPSGRLVEKEGQGVTTKEVQYVLSAERSVDQCQVCGLNKSTFNDIWYI